MSDLTITNAGVTVTPNSPGSSISTGRRAVIRVTPTCTTDALTSVSDVIFNAAEIPNAVREQGGCSKLVAAYVIDHTGTLNDLRIIYHQRGDIDVGPTDSSATANISEANVRLINILGAHQLDASEQDIQLSGCRIYALGGAGSTATSSSDHPIKDIPILLQSEKGSTSVYFSGITLTAETFAADSLQFIFHIEY